MKSIFLLQFFLFSSYFLFAQCGGEERWDVKTLQDPAAKKVKKKPTNTSVESLTKRKLPQKIGTHTPRLPAELKTYTLLATVKEYFSEGDDDIHIVLQDIKHPRITMIAEMPDYDCDSVKHSSFVKQFTEVRKKFKSLKKKDIIGHQFYFTGVVFFDLTHGNPQRGVAPNGIELHPVLGFHE